MLTRRLWIFPIWVWLIILVLSLGGFLWWRKRKSSDAGSGDNSSMVSFGGVVGRGGVSSGYQIPTGGNNVTNPVDNVVAVTRPAVPYPLPGDQTRPLPGMEADPAPMFTPDVPAARTTQTYVVQAGDTLSRIAQRFGLPNWQMLYTANASVIEAEARRHGYTSGSQNGHWIFPETRLVIPA